MWILQRGEEIFEEFFFILTGDRWSGFVSISLTGDRGSGTALFSASVSLPWFLFFSDC